jgi:hypothetical protein
MNLNTLLHGLLFALVAVVVLLVLAAPSYAGGPFATTFFQDIAGNRSKIIQLSIVFVLVGIALLFKK